MSYTNIAENGKCQDYILLNDGSYVEVWELDGIIYRCIWLPKHDSKFPSTIERFI